ncbi:MAG: hypothetical protein EA398_16895 [Deltaproteobacteria bacterium]|nr:MAG: hypothetical protein EA398_16895 [Deltaproteobacteria bacterium]
MSAPRTRGPAPDAPRTPSALLGPALALALLATACGDGRPDTTGESTPSAEAAPDAADTPPAAEEARRILAEETDALWASLLPEMLPANALENLLVGTTETVPLRRRLFLAHLYAGREFRPLFFRYGEPTPRTDALIDAVAHVIDQGVDPTTYLDDTLLDALELQARVARAWTHRPSLQLTDELAETVLPFLDRVDPDNDPRTVARRALRAALADTAEDGTSAGTLADLHALHELRLRLELERRGADAAAEALLADLYLRYAFDLRHANVRMFRGNVSEEERRNIVAERMEGAFAALAAARTADAVRELVLDELRPQHQQYAPLMAERRRYARIVAEGGWPEVRPFDVAPGRSHSRIPLLRERLRIEGYYHGDTGEGLDVSDRLDDALVQAIREYQETHQMDVTGGFYNMFWQSLNIPAEHRLAQIDLTLERWRESRIGDEDYFVFVNIPDFHAEVWRDGQRDMRFGVVVGNNRRVCNPRTNQMEMINATPEDAFMMTYMVLNPYWYIPRRIVEDDLLPQLLEDPEFFERMGYERYVTADGVELVRQIPGDNNALGRIKFMFPNTHNVYMHDTPQRALFGREIRQASSGCVRVSEPMEFMQYLLEHDGQWDERRIQRIFDSLQETGIVLRSPVPVYFEYYVVRTDDQGRANFLADIYRRDRARLDPDYDPTEPCEIQRPERRIVLSEDGRALLRDAEGNLFDPEGNPLDEDGNVIIADTPPGDGEAYNAAPPEAEAIEGGIPLPPPPAEIPDPAEFADPTEDAGE